MKCVALAVLLCALGCQSESPAESQPTPDPSPAAAPLAIAEKNVRIEEPARDSVIRSNPIKVRGQARTFENNVVIRVLDEQDQKMIETFTTAKGEMGRFSEFEKDVFLLRDAGKELTVEAFEHSAKDGAVQNLDSVTVTTDLRLQKVKLYFPSSKRSPNDCAVVFSEERMVPVSPSLARLLVEALIGGPVTPDLDNPFPSGSAVQSVNLRDGVLTVDFNERLANVGGSCAALAIGAAVERTLAELPNVRRVRITAMGSEKTALQP